MCSLVNFVASKLDNTLLRLDVKPSYIEWFVDKSIEYGVRGIVVHPFFVELIRDGVRGSTKLVSVVAFPYGYTGLDTKVKEALYCIGAGAEELDIVLNIYYIKNGMVDRFRDEAIAIKRLIKSEYEDVTIKYIVEITVLDRDELNKAIEIINMVEPDFFKTSTGHGPRGTDVNDVKYIRERLSSGIRLKAAGGIKSLKKFIDMVYAGADVIGASRGLDILREAERQRDE